ncbi:MAG: hypothetical protein LUG98_08800 [Tannerellaceae bacterium]|nr:hypothetical protein [Tannerellaceae bacterium]
MRLLYPTTFVHPFFFLCMLTIGFAAPAYAQLSEKVFYTDPRINPEETGNLSLLIDNLSFFKNNEYDAYFQKGYTLPGFWIKPRLVYQPLTNIRIEAGLSALCFWGADSYPNYAYRDIVEWKSDRYQVGMHFIPFLRAQLSLSEQVDIILGSIYGGANHELIEPLYTPELNLTADQETGLQVLYRSRYVKTDLWLNWESFIFKGDYHQEAFTGGLSTRVNLTPEEAEYHWYIPVQGLAQHRGGEIDTLASAVKTLLNGAVGMGVQWNANRRVLKNVCLEVDVTGYYQQAGDLWPFNSGTGLYGRVGVQLGDFRVKASYWQCNRFISMFGNAFYGAVSHSYPGVTMDSPKVFYLGAEYSYNFGKGYSMGVDVELYQPLRVTFNSSSRTWQDTVETSISCGIYLRLTPSFLLKNFQ